MCYLFSLLLSYDRYFFILAVKISQNRLKEDKLAVGDGQISSIAKKVSLLIEFLVRFLLIIKLKAILFFQKPCIWTLMNNRYLYLWILKMREEWVILNTQCLGKDARKLQQPFAQEEKTKNCLTCLVVWTWKDEL